MESKAQEKCSKSVRLRSGAVHGSDSSSSPPMGITLSSKKVEAISKTFESELGITSSMRSESIYNGPECVLKSSLLDPMGPQPLVQEDKEWRKVKRTDGKRTMESFTRLILS
ncbi:hypothetical protein QQF64_031538 [Cirrhinus molitorella]